MTASWGDKHCGGDSRAEWEQLRMLQSVQAFNGALAVVGSGLFQDDMYMTQS